jgi:hypothetical protein
VGNAAQKTDDEQQQERKKTSQLICWGIILGYYKLSVKKSNPAFSHFSWQLLFRIPNEHKVLYIKYEQRLAAQFF